MSEHIQCAEHLRCYELIDCSRTTQAFWGKHGGILVITQDTLKVRCDHCGSVELRVHPQVAVHVEMKRLTLLDHWLIWWRTRGRKL